jgi:hypothetical protein
MTTDADGRIDRYLDRELPPAAARALAHQALEDSDLFEELTALALAQAALQSPATTDRALAQAALDDEHLFDTLVARGAIETAVRTPHRRKHRTTAWAGVAAVAAGLLTFFVLRPSSHPIQQPAQQARVINSKPAVAPAILLTSDLQPSRSHDTPLFRGAGTPSRPPKSDGVVVSIDNGVANINLGSLDGIAKGTQLPVIRGRQVGRIVITTVFRDRARGKIIDGDGIRANDPLRVPTSAHLGAIVQQVDALAASGDLKAARDLAQNSLTGDSPGETRQLLERLAALDYQAGAPDAARDRYEVAVNNFDQPPAASSTERAVTLASYGALLLQSGDRQRADELLRKALAQAVEPTLRSQLLNNLGAVAELRGDQAKAAGYYNQALVQKTSKAERAILEANLARVTHP